MGMRFTMTKVTEGTGLRPYNFVARSSQPRRNGPIISTQVPVGANPNSLIWKLYNELLNNGPQDAATLARKMRASVESVKASLRDLRKWDINLNCERFDGTYIYGVAA